jgi:hypothetical protein
MLDNELLDELLNVLPDELLLECETEGAMGPW